jgi:acyl-CoA synthetase (NDP forming)
VCDTDAGPGAKGDDALASARTDVRTNLARMLNPETVAVVGASEQLGMSNNAVLPMIEAGREVALVNPRRDTLYGRDVYPDLASIGGPVDAVLSLVNAERSIEVVEQAAAMGSGGVVIAAAGFAESGDDGIDRQRRLLAVAGRSGIAVVGPNCAGFKNVPLGVNLFTGGRLDLPLGAVASTGVSSGVSVVSQSGFLARSAMAAARERALPVSIAISSGNEAVCDLADHVAVLADDPATSAICLVVETIRRPAEFFAAVSAARAVGKPVVALKLGRSDRSRHIIQSHTGAIADESWVYELAFREHGVVGASDIDDLLDRAQLFVQLPVSRRQPMRTIGLITTSGGVAALAADVADAEGAPYPPLTEIEPWVRERVPGDTVNPLDLTGFVMTDPELVEELFGMYASVVDALVLGWWTAEGDEGWSRTLLDPFANVAERSDIPFLVSPVEATGVGAWIAAWRARGVSSVRGLHSLHRSVDAMNRFLGTGEPRVLEPVSAPVSAPTNSAPPLRLVSSEVGPMVCFADAMRLLTEVGIPVAPWTVLSAGVDARAVAALGERLVVKLADVAHRTEIDAVRVGVSADELEATVADLRAIADRHALPGDIAVQAMVSGHAEAFAGLQCRTGLGPVVLLGLGGVLVELSEQITGRFLPVDEQAARALADEVAGADVLARARGQRPWPLAAVTRVVLALDRLWRQHGDQLVTVDLNPLVVTDDGLMAVDALMTAR